MAGECLICDRISRIRNGTDPYFVLELETGFVVLGNHQFYKGYTLFLCKVHATELHELEDAFKIKFLREMSMVAEAVYNTFRPNKLNYELLGNSNPHLHWHIIPRYLNDPQPRKPIWSLDKKIRCSEKAKPTQEELETLKKKLLSEFKTNRALPMTS